MVKSIRIISNGTKIENYDLFKQSNVLYYCINRFNEETADCKEEIIFYESAVDEENGKRPFPVGTIWLRWPVL